MADTRAEHLVANLNTIPGKTLLAFTQHHRQ
jgi:hypothetical protein